MTGRLAVLLILLPALVPLTGCTSVQASFPGHEPDQVWSALVATARSPSYDDMDPMKRWEARENEVWADSEGRRIEIYRRLHRFVYQSASRRHEESRRYVITVRYDPGPAPTATFAIRRGAIPAWTREAAARYFAHVRRLLGDVDEMSRSEAEAGPEETPASEPEGESEAPIDPGGRGT